MKIILPLFLFFLLSSCEKEAEASSGKVHSVVLSSPRYEAVPESPQYDRDENEPSQFEVKIIKNASLIFETTDLEKTARQVQEAVKKYEALVEKDVEGKTSYAIYKRMTIRIPSQQFEAFIDAIGKGISHFDEKEISSSDVTAEYIDTEARLKAKKVLENRYLELLKKASKVSEILEIEKELSAIREEIESKEGQLKYMKNRVAMSAVALEFYKSSPLESGAVDSYGAKMGNALKSGFLGVSSLFLWILNVWPFILILVVLFLIIRRRLKRKKA